LSRNRLIYTTEFRLLRELWNPAVANGGCSGLVHAARQNQGRACPARKSLSFVSFRESSLRVLELLRSLRRQHFVAPVRNTAATMLDLAQ
jgi:hypothetical protein